MYDSTDLERQAHLWQLARRRNYLASRATNTYLTDDQREYARRELLAMEWAIATLTALTACDCGVAR